MNLNDSPIRSHTARDDIADLALERLRAGAIASPFWQILLNHGQVRRTSRRVRSPGLGSHAFVNAMFGSVKITDGMPGLRYTEGLAFAELAPGDRTLFEHAWLEDEFGMVYETSWRPRVDTVYLGIPFSADEIITGQMTERGPMIWGDYTRGFPLLRAHAHCCEVPQLLSRSVALRPGPYR